MSSKDSGNRMTEAKQHESAPQSARDGGSADRKRSIWEDFKELRRLWPDLRDQRKLLFAAVGLIPLVSLLQTVSPMVLKDTIDHGMNEGSTSRITQGALLFLGAVLLEYASRSGQSLSTATAVHRMIRNLRGRLMRHIMNLPATYHDRTMSGALVTRATSDFDNLSESLNQGVLTSVVDCAVLAGCVIGMFALDWQLALISLLILPFVIWLVGWFSKGLKSSMLSARKKLAELNAFAQECLYGNATIKLLTAETAAAKQYHRMNIAFRNAQMESVFLDALMFAVLEGISSITIGLLLWWALAPHRDGLSAGVVVAFVQYVQQFFEPLKQLGSKMAMLQGAFTSIERIFGILDVKESIEGSGSLNDKKAAVVFDNVSFSYKGATTKGTLRGVSFSLSACSSLAIVGPTGAGKSTIVRLMTKMYDGYEGSIRIGNQELRHISAAALRENIAIVPQDIALFAGSVSFNISLGRAGITDEAIRWAAQMSRADRFISKLEGGYDHMILEQGSNLSQGERQLIAFARAIVTRPNLVVLDEATSSVDHESEAAIQEAIENILKDHTFIVIAHRLSTIRKCDQILVIEQGTVAEKGTHNELMALGAAYRRLNLLQST